MTVRRTLAVVCFVLACVLPAVALGTWWAYGLATDTDRFTEVARPLASDDAVQAQVVDELVAVAGSRLAGGGGPGPAAARRESPAVAETPGEAHAHRHSRLGGPATG